MGLIHRWPLTENANDVVGSWNLEAVGSAAISGGAASLTGGYFRTASDKTSPATGTLTQWISPTAWSRSIMCGVWTSGGGWNLLGVEGVSTDPSGGVNLWYTYSTNSLLDINLWNSSNYPNNAFVLVVFSFAPDAQKFYRNSTLVGEGTQPSFTTTGRFHISYRGDGFALAGRVLDSRIYDHALSQSEVDALVAAGPNDSGGASVRPRVPTPVILSTMPAALTRGFR